MVSYDHQWDDVRYSGNTPSFYAHSQCKTAPAAVWDRPLPAVWFNSSIARKWAAHHHHHYPDWLSGTLFLIQLIIERKFGLNRVDTFHHGRKTQRRSWKWLLLCQPRGQISTVHVQLPILGECSYANRHNHWYRSKSWHLLFIVCVQIYSVSYTNLLVNKIIRLKTISGFELFQLCQALCFLLRLCVYPEHVRPWLWPLEAGVHTSLFE